MGGGGGGSVTIGQIQIQYVLMAHSGGDGCFVFAVHSRWIRVALAKTGSEPCGDTKGESVCFGCFKRADVYI